MKNYRIAVAAVFLIVAFSCERPSSPDFNLQQSFDIPLIKSTSYKLIGDGKGAIIDTTSENFEDLFRIGQDRLVFLSTEIDFEFAELDDIIPDVDIEPTIVESEIGTLEIDDFSASFDTEIGNISGEPEDLEDEAMEIGDFEIEFDASGSAGFEEATGLDPADFGPGTPVPGPVDQTFILPMDTPGFVRAEVESGGLRFVFTNDLGFDLGNVSVTLLSNADSAPIPVGNAAELGSVSHGQSAEATILFVAGDLLEINLAFEVRIQWKAQNMASEPGELTVRSEEQRLTVRSATGNINAQVLRPEVEPLSSTNPDFEYAIVADDPGPGEAYQLELLIINNTPLEMKDSTLTAMPQITVFNSDGVVLDETKELDNITRPGATSLGPDESAKMVLDLRGQKLTAELTYQISMGTPGGEGLSVDREQFFLITSQTNDLKFVEVRSDIDPQQDILLEDTGEVKGDFVNAEVEEGELRLEISNQTEIPLFIEHLRFFNAESFTAKNTGRFFAFGSHIAEISNLEIPSLESRTVLVPLENTGISNRISYSGTASSPGTNEPVTVRATDLIMTEMEGSAQLSSASAVLKSQSFSVSDGVEFEDEDFRLKNEDHFVEIAGGLLRIREFDNGIDLDIDTLIVSFPGIRTDTDGSGRYLPSDSLWVEFSGSNRIRRASDTRPQPEFTISLENKRIYAPDNRVSYNVIAVTENTRNAAGDDSVRNVLASDRLSMSIEIEDVSIRTAFGQVKRRVEFLGEDDGDDGIIDLFNDREAEITEIEELEELAGRLSGLQLVNPSFDLIYDTNLGVRGTVIGAFLGINNKGEEVFLSGKPGTVREVGPGEDYHNLHIRGVQIPRSDLVAFEVTPSEQIDEMIRNQVIRFDSQTSNVEEFLSNLPVEVRFIGKIVVNPDEEDGFIVNPVVFDARMGIDIPINLSTAEGNPALFEDMISANLSGLPKPEDDTRISDATLYASYENGLPFAAGMTLEFLDENEELIFTSRGQPLDPVTFRIEAADVQSATRFVDRPKNGTLEIRLTGEQLDYLHRTRHIRLAGELSTSRDDISGEVKVRADDFIGISVNASFKTSIKVN